MTDSSLTNLSIKLQRREQQSIQVARRVPTNSNELRRVRVRVSSMCSSNFSNMLLKLIEMMLFTYFSILGLISSSNINKKMRIDETDSELEDVGSEMVDSQMTIDGHICLALSEQEEVVVPKRVSIAWLCFDKTQSYKKHGMNYVKCNQPRQEIQHL
jgi:hypothetical protein